MDWYSFMHYDKGRSELSTFSQAYTVSAGREAYGFFKMSFMVLCYFEKWSQSTLLVMLTILDDPIKSLCCH